MAATLSGYISAETNGNPMEQMDSSDMSSEHHDVSSSHHKNDASLLMKLNRKNFLLNYRLHYAMKSVFIHPFQQRAFSYPEFTKWVGLACEYSIKRTWKGDSACVLSFDTYAEADNAMSDLRHVLGDDVCIRHTKHSLFNPDQDLESVLDHNIRDSISTRVLLLESIPPDVTQEQIAEFFPDARAVMQVKHDSEVTGLFMVEYSSTDKVHKVLEEHKFSEDGRSYIVVDGQQVTMSKYKQRLNQAERAMRKMGSAEDRRKSYDQRALDDEERLKTCRRLRDLTEERDACLEDTMYEATTRVHTYVRLSEEMSMVAASLNWDAARREKERIALPEPTDMKTWQQLYKEDQSFGGDAYVKPISNEETKQVRSLLDLNPFEVPSAGFKRTQPLPLDAGPPKKLIESNMYSDGNSASSVSDCMQNLRSLSTAISIQVSRMDELLHSNSSSNGGGDSTSTQSSYRTIPQLGSLTSSYSTQYRNDCSNR